VDHIKDQRTGLISYNYILIGTPTGGGPGPWPSGPPKSGLGGMTTDSLLSDLLRSYNELTHELFIMRAQNSHTYNIIIVKQLWLKLI